jgi:phosphinothricin acetyltransferase
VFLWYQLGVVKRIVMIRDVQLTDAEAICDIYNYYITETVVTFEEKKLIAHDIKKRILSLQLDNYPWLVALNNDRQLIGYAYAAKWRERHSLRYTAEVTVYLSTKSSGKGVGSKLYQALFSALKDRGIHRVIGGITLPNPESVALHEKFSMTKVAHFNEVGLKFDRWLDVGFWQGSL